MKKKLALLMAAIMTVAMVPMTAFASTKLTAVDEVRVATETNFTSRVELLNISCYEGHRYAFEIHQYT